MQKDTYRVIESCYHCEQLRTNGIKPEVKANLDLFLPGDFPTANYDKKFQYSTIHWGQLKLFFSELYLLTNYAEKGNVVVYVGAAPGIHIPTLQYMFAKLGLYYYLVDPQPILVPVTKKTKVVQDYYNTENFVKWLDSIGKTNKDVIFISDIRRGARKDYPTDKINDQKLMEDNLLQQKWVVDLQPKVAMLKFKLPLFEPPSVNYLDGQIMFPVWGRDQTTESRLIVTDVKFRDYNCNLYNGQMVRFNTHERAFVYKVANLEIINFPGIDKCFDCTASIAILSDYKEKFDKRVSIYGLLSNIISDIGGTTNSLLNRQSENKIALMPNILTEREIHSVHRHYINSLLGDYSHLSY